MPGEKQTINISQDVTSPNLTVFLICCHHQNNQPLLNYDGFSSTAQTNSSRWGKGNTQRTEIRCTERIVQPKRRKVKEVMPRLSTSSACESEAREACSRTRGQTRCTHKGWQGREGRKQKRSLAVPSDLRNAALGISVKVHEQKLRCSQCDDKQIRIKYVVVRSVKRRRGSSRVEALEQENSFRFV
ncbi:hypothetical protein Anapl_08700 [Anas platyrhynchos]|uniref:Uncharacterized protein n=1 Tax=Anas platyrhynchos TaxID=8839 RepID=R0JWW2_ANAPL|nr:hypothetical protein Anapl_08700 [Anas platyrhynchos]